MDTASPIASRGQSTTIATGTVGARCLTPSEHAAHRSRMYADGRRMHLQPHSSPLQLPDTTVAPTAPGYVARTLARLQIANSPQHCKNLDATLAASAARLQIGLPGSLRSSCASAPALRDPAATGAPNQLAGQVAQAGGLKMDLEDARSETLSQPPYSDAESSASSIGGESGASSCLSLVGSSRPRQPPKCRVRGSVAPRAPVPERTTGRKLSEPFNAEMDQRLRQLVEAHQRANISSD
eukprot:scaffold39990_cov67-Phaeocystis_antarctica.AAC.5